LSIPLRQYGRLLARYLRPLWPAVAALTALLLPSTGLQLVNPRLLRYFIDTAQAGGAARALANAALAFVGVAVAQQALEIGATFLSETIGWKATNALRADLAEHCLRLDLAFHSARTPGELIERIDGDITALAGFFSQLVIKVLGNGLLLAGVLAALYLEDWRVGAALTVVAGVALTVLTSLRRLAGPYWAAALMARADVAC
jgi:ABC-type multidrug transport system fused ATPase/permease subunit